MANKIDTVVWDADNTLWDWISMHLAGMRAMSAKISEIIKVPEEEVKESMKRAYDKAETLDHKPLVQDMDVVEEWVSKIKSEREKIRQVIDMAFAIHAVYTHSRHANFRTYPGVHAVLRRLSDAKVDNVILSDAPLTKIVRRTKQFRIDKYFKAIYGRPDKGKKDGYLKWYEGAQAKGGAYKVAATTQELVNRCKPKVDLAELLGKDSNAVPDTVAMVGDNFFKDIGTAHHNNCTGFFAHYGVAHRDSVNGLYEYGTPKVVSRNSAGIDLSKENIKVFQDMGPKLIVVDRVREVADHVLES